MPKMKSKTEVRQSELPDTLKRSPAKAQRQFAKTHDAAAEQYGEGERAHRTAFAALKHTHEKQGDRWVPKQHSGPSDAQAERGAADQDVPTKGGVDANASKKHLMDVARKLDVKGRSSMTKDELADAIDKANRRATARARRGS